MNEAADPRKIVAPLLTPDPSPTVEPPDGEKEPAAPEILIPAYVDPNGRDSLGRGLDAASIAVAVAADRAVQREREALWLSLRTAYRDPHAAKALLDEMVKRQGWTSTAVRLRPDPTQLGALHGRSGLFAGRWAKLERAGALGSANGIASHLEHIGAAEAKAARTWRASVEAQREADATPIPKLSARAEAAVTALAAAPDEHVRAALWRDLTTDKALGAEMGRFSAAVRQRFGEDTVRGVVRSGGSLEAAPLSRAHQATLAAISLTVQTLGQGERAVRQEDAQRLNQGQTLGSRPRMRP